MSVMPVIYRARRHADARHWNRSPGQREKVEKWETSSFGGKTIAGSVKDNIEFVQQSELLSEELKKGTKGYILDIKTGVVTEVQ